MRNFLQLIGRHWRRLALGGAVVVLMTLAGAAYWFKTVGLRRTLESAEVRTMVEQKSAEVLDAPTGYRPFRFRANTVYSDGVVARGAPPSPLTLLEARDLQVHGSWLAGWRTRRLKIDRLQVGAVRAAYGPAGAKLLPPPDRPPAPDPALQPPRKTAERMNVEIERVSVARADIAWGGKDPAAGALLGTGAECVSAGAAALSATLKGGEFRQSGWPDLRLQEAKMRFAQPTLSLENAKLLLPAAGQGEKDGQVTANGQVRFEGETPLEVQLLFAGCPVSPFEPARWRQRLSGGRFDGEAKISSALQNDRAPLRCSGWFDAGDGALQEVRILDEIARITGKAEFRRLRLRRLRGNYAWDNGKLAVTDFQADLGREKLLRIEGRFEVADERVRGEFELGVAPDALEPIPGARKRVFDETHDGYAWTHVKLTGPLSHPRENLRERLVAAAEEEIAGKFLGPLLGPGKEALKLLRDLGEIVD